MYLETGREMCVSVTQVDWDEVTGKLSKLETDCKTSWDHLRAVVKHDMAPSLKSKSVTLIRLSYWPVRKKCPQNAQFALVVWLTLDGIKIGWMY